MNRFSPVAVQGLTGAIAIGVSAAHSCAALRDGTVKCWGDNTAGQLGTGASSTTPALTALGVAGVTTATNVFVGGSQTCTVHRNGSAQCWGSGFLGNGTTTSSLTPVAVAVPNGVRSIVVGPFHACSLQTSGGVYCWGPPALKGLGTTSGDPTPSVVPNTLGSALGLGLYSTCVLRNDGAVVWWDASLTPAPVPGLSRVVALSTTGTNACHILDDGTVSCWTILNAKLTSPIVVGGLDLW